MGLKINGITESPLCTGQVTIYSGLVVQNIDFITLYISEARMEVLLGKK